MNGNDSIFTYPITPGMDLNEALRAAEILRKSVQNRSYEKADKKTSEFPK